MSSVFLRSTNFFFGVCIMGLNKPWAKNGPLLSGRIIRFMELARPRDQRSCLLISLWKLEIVSFPRKEESMQRQGARRLTAQASATITKCSGSHSSLSATPHFVHENKGARLPLFLPCSHNFITIYLAVIIMFMFW